MLESITLWASGFIGAYGTLGLFLVILIGSTPIPIPVEMFALAAVAAGAAPLLTTILTTIGSTLGGFFTYLIGAGALKAFRKFRPDGKKLKKAHEWLEKYGMVSVFIFALTPLPFDAIAFVAGTGGMRKREFLLATFAGRLLRYALLIYTGYGILNIL